MVDPHSLTFKPTAEQRAQMPLFPANRVPRYLFRVYDRYSVGETTEDVTKPGGAAPDRNTTPVLWADKEARWKSTRNRDMFSQRREVAAELLWRHLRWTRDHEHRCSLVSWSSSLLVVLQYALFRHKGRKEPPRADLADINLLVLDTRDFPPGTFAIDMELMASFEGIYWRLDKFIEMRRGKVYRFGEWLSQGVLDLRGRCVQTNMQRLLHDCGAFELVPTMRNKVSWNKWANAIVEHRRCHFESSLSSSSSNATHADVRLAIGTAQACFGGRWTAPMAVALLSLVHRGGEHREDILSGFAAMFSG